MEPGHPGWSLTVFWEHSDVRICNVGPGSEQGDLPDLRQRPLGPCAGFGHCLGQVSASQLSGIMGPSLLRDLQIRSGALIGPCVTSSSCGEDRGIFFFML